MKRNRGRQPGHKLSQKTKDKIAASRTGQKQTTETKGKISEALMGYRHYIKPKSIEELIKRHLKWLNVSFVCRINNGTKGPFSPSAMVAVRRDTLNRLKFLSSDGVIAYLTLEQRIFLIDGVLKAFDRSYFTLSHRTIGYQAQLDDIREALSGITYTGSI